MAEAMGSLKQARWKGLAGVWVSVLLAGSAASAGARIEIPRDEIDFGLLTRGAVAEVSFEVKNEGDAALLVRARKPGCGCMVASVDEEIPPGAVGYVSAFLDTRTLKGVVAKKVTLDTNDPEQPLVRFVMRADVSVGVEMLPRETLVVGYDEPGATLSRRLIRRWPLSPGTVVIDNAEVSVPWLEAHIEPVLARRPAEGDLPRARAGDYVVELRPRADMVYGPVSGTLEFDTGMEQEPRARFPIEGVIDAPLRVAPSRVDLPSDRESTTLTVSVRPGWDTDSLTIQAEPEGIRHELEPTAVQGVYQLHVRWEGQQPASGQLMVRLGRDRVRVPVARAAGSPGR